MVQNLPAAGKLSSATSHDQEAVEHDIREICAEVLRRPVGKIKMDKSFLAQGGDSLLAIKLMARCGEAGYNITIHDMLQATSIRKLCQSVKQDGNHPVFTSTALSELDGPSKGECLPAVPLKGAQRFYAAVKAWDVKLLRLERDTPESDVLTALKSLVSRHPILRAKIIGDSGHNEFRITDDANDLFEYETMEISTGFEDNAEKEVMDDRCDERWNSGRTSLFVVFVQQGTCLARFVRVALHRAIADTTSWDIIQHHLEHALLGHGLGHGQPRSPFGAPAESNNSPVDVELEFSTSAATCVAETNTGQTVNGWGGAYGHGNEKLFISGGSKGTTDLTVLETDATVLGQLEDSTIHTVLRTQPVDFVIAALFLALAAVYKSSDDAFTFGIITNDRFGSDATEPSQAVGSFDRIARLCIRREKEETVIEFLRRVKDTRLGFTSSPPAAYSGNQRSYVLLDMARFGNQPSARSTAVREVSCLEEFLTLPCAALVYLRPFWRHGQPKLRFQSRSAALDCEQLGQIAGVFRASLKELIAQCHIGDARGTLSDFPFLGLTYTELDNLVSTQLKRITSDPFQDVEAIFPCTARQESFLVAQAVYPDLYQCSFVVRIKPEGSETTVDVARLQKAWSLLTERHAALRTVFIESANRQGHFDQVVLKSCAGSRTFLEDGNEGKARELSSRRPVIFRNYYATHQVTFCRVSPSSVYLRLDMSHAIVDGQSAQVLLRDLSQIYSNQQLSEPVMPYQNFVAYQMQLPAAASMAYWSRYLSGAQPSYFPLHGDSMGRQDLRTVRHQIDLGSAVLEELCGKFSVTPANICQVAWALVLRSYTGLEDICFSYATSGRDAPLQGINNTVGAFLNAVICRVRMPGMTTVSQALIQAKKDFVESLAHQFFSTQDNNTRTGDFVRLKGNTLMSCQRKTATELDGSGLGFDLIDAVNPNEYDMSINIQTGPVGLEVMIDYWKSRIGHRTVESVAQSFEQAFISIINQENALLGEIDIITPRELAQLREWNSNIPPSVEYRIHDKVYEQRLRQPDAWAVQGWDGNLTYGQLDDAANSLASHLIGLGVGPETKVPLCFEKSKWAVVSQLAVLKAGGCVVPLGTKQPMRRTEIILQDLQATMILTTKRFASHFDGLLPHIVVVDEGFMAGLPSCEMPPCPATIDNCAFIIYTSGSTGVPKGVVLPHASLCTSLQHMGAKFKLGPHSRTVQFSAYTFDISIQDIYTTWHYGGCLCVISEEDRIGDLASAMDRYQVNCAGLTSTVAGLILPQDVPSLRTLILLGEAVKPVVVEQWIDHVEVFNAYGPSECSMQASINRLTPGCNALNIGYAFAGALWVVDPNDYNRLVPIGAPGELLIEGPLQARGYLNDPAKTATAFVTDAAWMIKNGFRSCPRLYRTGDLVQQNPDGSITYIGRRDTQIKVRGQRVEVGEIEHHLMQQNAVLDAAIIYPRQGPCQDRLVGLITLRDFFSGKQFGPDIVPVPLEKLPLVRDQIAAACRDLTSQVPDHMLPGVWIPLESMMPQNDSSKLDRKRLGQWVETIDTDFVEALTKSWDGELEGREPATLLEREVQNAWSDVLRLRASHVQVEHKSFLGVGGDSITAMHVVSWLRARGISVAVRDVLESKSVAQLAEVAQRMMRHSEAGDEPFPLSAIQQWYFETISPLENPLQSQGPYRYNTSVCLVPQESLDFDSLARALDALVSRHPLLRARFQRHSVYGWRQTIVSEKEDSYHLGHHIVGNQQEADAIIAAAQAGLDLENGPVFSAQFIQIVEEDVNVNQLLFMTAHHLVVDEISCNILSRDLGVLLRDKSLASSSPVPFRTWAQFQAEKIQQRTVKLTESATNILLPYQLPKADLEYWGLAKSNIYRDEVVEQVTLDRHQTEFLLEGANNALRTKPAEVLLAALVKSFHDIFPDRPLPPVFEMCHGRDTVESGIDISSTVGWFTSIEPVLISVDNAENALDILRKTKDTRRRTSGTGLSYLESRLLTPEEKSASEGHGQMEILFRSPAGTWSLENKNDSFRFKETTGPETSAVGGNTRRASAFEIDFSLSKGGLHIMLKFNRLMNHQAKIRAWMQLYANTVSNLLRELTAVAPTFTLSDFPLLSLTAESLGILQEKILPKAGIRPDDIEDIYPCSPIQQGILMSQVKSPSEYYYIQQSFEVVPLKSTGPINVHRLLEAWQLLVNRHPILRTLFVRSASTSSDSVFEQVVLKSCKADAEHNGCDEDELMSNLAVKSNLVGHNMARRINHKLMVYTTPSKKVYAKIIVSHALVDAYSLTLLQRELAQAYEGKLAEDSTGPAYSAYVSYLQQCPADSALEYWTTRLADAEPCYLPSLIGAGAQAAGAESATVRQPLQTISMDIDCLADLHRFSHRHGVTMANVFQLAWALVLAQYTGSNNVSFGYLSSGRDVPVKDIHQIVGPLINMMVTHIQLDPDVSVQQKLEEIQDNFFQGFNYQRAPLFRIWHSLQLQGKSLFNTALSYRHIVSPEKGALDLALEQVAGEDPTEYDVTVSVFAAENNTTVSLQYSPSFMCRNSAAWLVRCLRQAVHSLVVNEDLSLGRISILTPEDLEQVRRWNKQIPTTDGFSCIQNLISRQRLLRPDAPAVCAWDGDLTYQELDDTADKLAHHLVSDLGVGLETMVALCFDKSLWAIVAQLSVLKAGGVVVPVNPKHPTERLEAILQDINARVMLTTEQYSARFTSLVQHVLHMDADLLSALPAKAGSPCEEVSPDNAAFIIYTSGSTGMPKGVILTHFALCSSFQAHGKAYGMTPSTRSVQFAAYTFDASISDIWCTITHGGCVCVISEAERMDNLQEAIESYGATHAQLTPTVAGLLDISQMNSLTTLILGGEPVKEAMVEEYARAAGKVRVLNGYGPSECSIYTTCSAPLVEKRQALNIGRPLVGSVWVVANGEHISPVGAVGELWIEGPLLARGYLHDKQKTDASFVSNPKWAKALGLEGRRFYRTGDLARQNSNGDIIYHSRRDTQVKIRGQRVEVGEIEYRVKKLLPEVINVVASLITPGGNSSSLIIALAMELHDQLLQPQLLSEPVLGILLPSAPHLREAFDKLHASLTNVLPSYMLPGLFVPVMQLPQTASGKLDRRYLKQILESLPEEVLFQYSLSTDTTLAPATETEKTLQSLWATVLNVDLTRVGVHDHFLHLGGDSFSAMRLVSTANSSGILLTVADVFCFPKLQDMAAHVDELVALRQHASEVPQFGLWKEASECDTPLGVHNPEFERVAGLCNATVEDIEDVYPCTPLQEGLMAITTQQAGAYIGRWVFRIHQDTEIAAFKRSWAALAEQVPILRTRIVPGLQYGALQVVIRESMAWKEGNDLKRYLNDDLDQSFGYGEPLVRQGVIEASNDNRYFILTAHHSVYDGYSLGKLFDTLTRIYYGEKLPPMPPFSRFLRYIDQQNPSAARSFWKSQLEGEVGSPFPSLPRPSCCPLPSRKLNSTIDVGPMDSFTTLASTLRAAWALAVSAYGGNDVLFGVALSGRAAPVPGILDMLAPTITTVPVRVRIDPEQSVHDYLDMVHRQSVEMIPFEHTGLQNIRRFVSREIDLPHLFAVQPAKERGNSVRQKLVSYEHGHVPELSLHGYALTVECTPGCGNDCDVAIEARFDENMISVSQTRNLLNRFRHVFSQLIEADSDQRGKRLGELEMLSKEEATQLLKFNCDIPKVKQALVHDLVYQQVLRDPNAPAVCSWDGNLSRGELDDLAEKLAHHLTGLGVRPEVMVTLCLEKSKWALVANLAVLKAGGAVVPIRVDPIQRVQTILRETRSAVILTSPNYASALEGMAPHILALSDGLLASLSNPLRRTNSGVSASNTAFVIFTSGSTGIPKGVVLEHGAMSTSMQSHGARFGMNENTRAFQFAHFTFDISLHDIITTLQFGGCVCFPSGQERVNDMAGSMRRMGVNYSFLPPRVIHTIKPSEVPGLRTLVVGGEAVQAEHLEPWLHGVQVFNAYGPAECCIISTCNEVANRTQTPNIGRALAGGLWVVDEDDYNRLLPLGAVGELLIEGPLLARGYLNDPMKTAKSFINNPTWVSQYLIQGTGKVNSLQTERRMYRTGDLVRQTEDGSLLYVGRTDGQVKIRGQRVEIGEIEHHVTEHPAVVEAVIVYPRSGPSQSKLVGILTLRDFICTELGTDIQPVSVDQLANALQEASSVREYLLSRVPEYMIPQFWVTLVAMPHNTSDKIDRRRLTQWLEIMDEHYFESITRDHADETFTTPSTLVEQNIQAAWAETLQVPVEKISLNRPFLSVGGDSVTAMQVVSRCRSHYDIALTVRDVLQSQSVTQLSSKAAVNSSTLEDSQITSVSSSPAQSQESRPNGTGDSTFNISAHDLARLRADILPSIGIQDLSDVENIYSCSPIQQGILISQTKDRNVYQVRQVGAIRSASPTSNVDLDQLLRAWQAVIQRHAILRTVLVPSPSGQELFYQVVLKHYVAYTPVRDSNGLEDILANFAAFERPKYAPDQPPYQLTLCRTPTGQVFAQIDVNHVLMDASSMDLILNDLTLAYDGALSISPAPSYGDYVSFLQQTSASKSLDYWVKRLAKAQPTYLAPWASSKAETPSLRSVSGEIDNLEPLQDFRDAYGVTLANIVQLAWAIVLSRYTGSRDILFGYLSNGRDAPVAGIHEMAGPMVNLMVTRIQLESTGRTVVEAAKQVQDQFLDAFTHQRASLADIQHALQISDSGLFNTTMIYKPKPTLNIQDKRSLVLENVAGEDPTEYDVQVKVVTDDKHLTLELEYASTFLDDGSAQRLLSSLQCVIASIAANPQATLDDLEIISPADIESIRTWNSTFSSTIPGCVHHKIRQQALSQPAAQAICAWDGQLSYGELDDLAGRLAHYLSSLGVHEEVMVGLCFEKSMWTVVAMVAVLKCGGVAVPLGAQLPVQRLRHILEDTAAPVVLTSAQQTSIFSSLSVANLLTVDAAFLASLPKVAASQPIISELNSESAAVVIYTSGSTGRPKGVVLTHGSLSTSVESHGLKLQLGPSTRALQYSAYAFDISLLDVLSTLYFGGCGCVVSEEDRVDIHSLTKTMEAMGVNFAVLTPTVAGLIDPRTVPTLSTLVLAGEAVPPSAAEAWSAYVSLFNGYGPAECTILAAANGPIQDKDQASNVGTALSGALWVVDADDHNRLAPIGVVGELLISGPLLARGYLNDAERTSQSFIRDPAFISKHGFHLWAGQRMYRTGDLVRQNPTDGSITYVGRADGQVKVRGQRVEVGEIEYWVKRHYPSAQTVAADLTEPKAGGSEPTLAVAIELQTYPSANGPTSFISLTGSLKKSLLQLQASLTRALPSFMVPAMYIPMHQMPLTASGKLDRRSLRALLEGLSEEQLTEYGLAEENSIELSTETERRLASLWAEALKWSREISANAHFFRLGGDSVTAMRLVALARSDQPPILLTVANIFRNPILSQMAGAIDSADGSLANVTAVENVAPFALWANAQDGRRSNLEAIASQCMVASDAIEDIYPCTPLQQGLMAITAQHPQTYISRWVFRLDDSIDAVRFREAWQQVFDHVPALRTRIIQDAKSAALQVVVRDRIEWNETSSDLECYIAQDSTQSMGFGDRLAKFAIVNGPEERFFVWTAHHSTYDGWTTRKIIEAVSAFYYSKVSPTFLPFTHFVNYVQIGSVEAAHDYWQAQMRGGIASKFPETPKNYRPAPSQDLSRRIRTDNANNDFTVSTLLRATWALILSHETGSCNVGFATALSGRTAPVAGILDIMGPTITTVPVRISLDPSQSLSAFLAGVQQQATDMLPFEHTGLHNISQIAGVPFDFKHLFVVQPAVDRLDQVHSTFQGLSPVPLEASQFHSYPLVVECSTSTQEDASFVDLQIQFDPAVLSRQKATALSESFEHVFKQLCNSVAACPEFRVGDINFMTPADISRIQEWNRFDETMSEADTCVHELVHQQQLSRPEAPAVCAWDGTLSYQQLDQMASRLAYHLVELGVGPEVAVAVVFEKTQWAVVTYVAVLKAGGIIVPINHQHPSQRVQSLVQATSSRIILSSQDPQYFRDFATHVLKVDQELLAQLPAHNDTPLPTVRALNSAFIIFTSGSTGMPKGVVLEHGAIVSSIKAHGSFYAGPNTRALQFSAFNFDISIAEIFTTLVFGGCVCIISEDDRVNRLADAMEGAAVNFAILTPTIANLIEPEHVPSLQKMLLVGEALRPEVALPWISSHVELYNAYGPAESSILTTFSHRIVDANQAPNIGLPLAHSNLWVVDPSDYHKLLPVGMIGELLIEGPLLARGYLGDEQKTAEAFVTDPAWLQEFDLGPVSGRRFYRTGDMVQQNPDGSFVYVGRRDTQVKIHGQRVEIGEIEYWVKKKLSDVREVAAGLFNPTDTNSDGHANEPLLAVTMEIQVPNCSGHPPREDSPLLPICDGLRKSLTNLHKALLEVLPSHMVPQLYLPVTKLPLTDSGKLDRRAAWRVVQECTSWSQYFLADEIMVPPSTDTERLLQSLWAIALKVSASSIGAKDDFFRSGGDSISAMRLVASAREHAQLTLKVSDVFQYPILSDMAMVIGPMREETSRSSAKYEPFSALESAGSGTKDSLQYLLSKSAVIVDAAPTTDLQALAIATSLRKSRDLMAYVSIDGKGFPDIARWEASIRQLVECYDILRTAYVCHAGQFFQVVLQDYEPGLTHYETDQSVGQLAKQLIAQDMHRPPQLGTPFLEFAIIASHAEGRHRILFRLSHAEYDAISLSYFMNTLQEIYQGQPVTEYVGFPRYIAVLASQDLESSREFWRTLLKGSSMPAIATRSAERRLPSRQVYHDTRRVNTTKALPSGITMSTVVRAAWAYVLARHVGNSDVIFGEVVSSRNSGDSIAEKTAGCCANMVPVRASFNGSWRILDLLQSVQKQLISRLPHETLGFRDIIKSCTDMTPGTLFTSLLNHLDKASEWTLDLEYGRYHVSVAKSDGAGDVSDVSITSTGGTGYVEIAMAYLEDGITAEIADELLGRLCATVDHFVNEDVHAKLDTVLPISATGETRAESVELTTPKFKGDLVEASVVAFELQQKGLAVTIDDVVEQGLNTS